MTVGYVFLFVGDPLNLLKSTEEKQRANNQS